MSLRARTLMLVVVPLVILFAGGLLISFQRGADAITRLEQARLSGIATTLAANIDGDAVREASQSFTERDAISDWSQATPPIIELRQKLSEAAYNNSVTTPIYMLLPDPDQLEVIASDRERVHTDAMIFGVTSAIAPYWHHRYDYRPLMGRVLFDGDSAVTGVYDDDYGSWVSAYAPVRDAQERVVGILEVDETVDAMLVNLKIKLLTDFAWVVTVLLSVVGVAVLLYRPVARGFKTLEVAVASFSTKSLAKPLVPAGPREIRAVTQTLEQARAALLERERGLQTARDSAERASRAKSEFLMAISHELRTPLNGIHGTVQGLDEERALAPSEFSTLAASTARLRNVVEQVLIFVALEDNTVELHPAPFSIADLKNVLQHRYEIQASERGVEINWRHSTSEGQRIIGDILRIRQAVEPLVDNAIKFEPSPGQIDVELRMEGESLFVECRDHGPGIDGERIEELRQPFAQGDSGDRRGHDGLGLGLAVASRMAKTLGGGVDFVSQEEPGCIVRLRVPVTAAPPLEPPMTRSEDHGRRILVVEDNPANQRIAQLFLKKAGWEVTIAENGRVGVETWASAPDSWAAVLMDIQMPILDGIEATREIRGLEVGEARVPILALTADGREETRERAHQAGVDGYLTKPLDRSELIDTVDSLVAVPV